MVRNNRGCFLSSTLFNIILEKNISDALEEHDGKVSIGGRTIANLRFADDIDTFVENEQELEALAESRQNLDKVLSAERTKLKTNSANAIRLKQ